MTTKSPTTGLYPRQQDLVDATRIHPFVCAYGSSRGGKSYTFVKLIVLRAQRFEGSAHLIVRKTSNSIKTTIWGTIKQVLKDMDLLASAKLNTSDYTITFENGSQIVCGGVADDQQLDKILGSEYQTVFFNEATNISYEAYETVSTRLNGNVFDARGTRLELKTYVDCNPTTKACWIYQLFDARLVPGTKRELEDSHEYTSLAFDQESNPSVDPGYYRKMRNRSAVAQKRFLAGQWADEVEGALFRAEDIEQHRLPTPAKHEFDMTVVSIDPATTANETSDETGIMVMGKLDGHCYPIEDLSGRYRPEEWGRKAVDAYHAYGAACIRIETNQGGDAMVYVIKSIDANVNVKTFHAGVGQGKNARAQPVAAEMAAGHIHMPMEPMEELEAQMLAMTGDYDRRKAKSPDRLDAMVYAVAELVLSDNTPSRVMASTATGFWR